MKIHLTPDAIDDIANIKSYIRNELDNPIAANRIGGNIAKSYKLLRTSPYMGFSVKGKYGVDSLSRILVSGQYIIFYEVDETKKHIEILNVFHGKQNYIKRLFPDYEEPDGEDV